MKSALQMAFGLSYAANLSPYGLLRRFRRGRPTSPYLRRISPTCWQPAVARRGGDVSARPAACAVPPSRVLLASRHDELDDLLADGVPVAQRMCHQCFRSSIRHPCIRSESSIFVDTIFAPLVAAPACYRAARRLQSRFRSGSATDERRTRAPALQIAILGFAKSELERSRAIDIE